MATYSAQIQVGVTGQRELEQLRSQITRVNTAIDSLNNKRIEAGSLTQSLSAYQTQLARATRGLADAQLGTEQYNKALNNYVTSLGKANAAEKQHIKNIDDATRAAMGLQTQEERNIEVLQRFNKIQSGRFRQKQLQEEAEATQKLTQELEDANRAWQMFEHKGKLQHAAELEEAAAAFKRFKDETISANNALEAAIQTGNRLARIQQSVATTQERQSVERSAAMMRTENMARLYREQNPISTTPLLPYGDPTLPSVRGGARTVGQQREILGGARTADEAAATLRWAAATDRVTASVQETHKYISATTQEILDSAAALEQFKQKSQAETANVLSRARLREQETQQLYRQAQLADKISNAYGYSGKVPALRPAGMSDAQVAELNKKTPQRGAVSGGGTNRLESLALGAGFPLMFGAGPGMLAGSIAGSFFGSGFGGQIIGGAVGQIFDEFASKTMEVGRSLQFPLEAFDDLNEKLKLFDREAAAGIKRLEELGRAQEAANIIQQRIIGIIGMQGVEDLQTLGTTTLELANAWGELNLQMQAAIAGPLADMLKWLAGVVRTQTEANAKLTKQSEIEKRLSAEQQAQLRKEAGAIFERTKFNFDPSVRQKQIDQLYGKYDRMVPAPATSAKLSPEQQLEAAKKQLDAAERAESLRRRGVDLELAAQNFKIKTADDVYSFQQRIVALDREAVDFRRSIEDKIFQQRQDIQRKELDVARQTQQLAIEQMDMRLNAMRLISNQPGTEEANALLDAARTYLRTRAEGEADLQRKEKELVLDLESIKKAAATYKFDVERKIVDMNRRREEYTRDVTNWRFQTEQAVAKLKLETADYEIAKTKERIALEVNAQKAIGMTTDLSTSYEDGNPPPPPAGYTGGPITAGELRSSGFQSMIKSKDPIIRAALAAPSNSQSMSITSAGIQQPVPAAVPRPAISKLPAIPKAPVVEDITPLIKQSQDLNQKLLDVKKQAQEINKAFTDLGSQKALQQLAIQTEQTINRISAPLEEMAQSTTDRINEEKQYARLIAEGISPEVAKITVETEKQVKLAQQKLDISIESQRLLADAVIAEKGIFSEEATALLEQINALQAGRDKLQQTGQGVIDTAAADASGKQLRQYITQLQTDLNDTEGNILNLSQTIQTELSTAMSTAVTGVIQGTTTVQQAFSQMFANIGQAFIQMATQMIAKALVLKVLGIFTGGAGAGGGGGLPGFGGGDFGGGGLGLSGSRMFAFANGGTPPVGRASLVGERGPELFVPRSSGTILPADTTTAVRTAMAQQQSTATTTAPVLNMSFETTRFGDTEYVSRDQLEAAMAQTRRQAATDGAKQGMMLTLDRLQQSPRTRSRVGLA